MLSTRTVLVTFLFATCLAACKPTVVGCKDDDDSGAFLPDSSFEDEPSQWTLAEHSSIDGERGVCDGSKSLRIQLDEGLGSGEVTRSEPITGVLPDTEYVISFHYRFENCKDANLVIDVGNYNKRISFTGTKGAWAGTDLVVKFGNEPTAVEIHPYREGSADAFVGDGYTNNLMWIDDFTIEQAQ